MSSTFLPQVVFIHSN